MNMLFCILFRYLDFSIILLLVGERSLDATAGNPQSAGDKAWRKRCAARSIGVHDRPWDVNVPKSHFYELILQDRHPNTISKLSAKYQFCAIRTADTRDSKLTTRGIYPWVVHRLSIVCPPFVHRLYPPDAETTQSQRSSAKLSSLCREKMVPMAFMAIVVYSRPNSVRGAHQLNIWRLLKYKHLLSFYSGAAYRRQYADYRRFWALIV